MKPAGLSGREDMRDMPLITIDPWDARDHDDACWAHADDDPANEGGHVIWVAIADVAHYVHPGSELDIEARKRGNSSYFPDRVVPMLPDRLSGDLCSLHEGVPRACIAVRMQVDAEGQKISHQVVGNRYSTLQPVQSCLHNLLAIELIANHDRTFATSPINEPGR